MRLLREGMLAAALAMAAAIAGHDAGACYNVTYSDSYPARDGFELLTQSESNQAALRAQYGRMHGPPAEKDDLALASQRVVAVAIVRNDGVLLMEGFKASASDNLAWAMAILRFAAQHGGDDPVAQSHLAEGLERTGEHAEALRILGDLAKADLLGSGEGYAALARLQIEHGDAAAGEASMARCRVMTKKPAVVCVPAKSG
jgi:hypothetical protein